MTEEERKAKKKAYMKEYREKNREKLLEYGRVYDAGRREDRKPYMTEYLKQYTAEKGQEISARRKGYWAEYRKQNADKLQEAGAMYRKTPEGKRYAFRRSLRKLYGLGESSYDAMVVEACGRCAACGRADDGSKARGLCVDHDHDTGRVRGLICHHCNVALGLMGESPERVAALASYIRREVIVDDWSI